MNAQFQAKLNEHKQEVAKAQETVTLTIEQLQAIIDFKIAQSEYKAMMEREGCKTGFVLTPEWNKQWDTKKRLFELKCNHIVGEFAGNVWD